MIQVKTFQFNPFGECTYVVYDVDSSECAIIDPGCSDQEEWSVLNQFIDSQQLLVKYIWVTHSHVDHVLGTGRCARTYRIEVSGSADDQRRLPPADYQAQLFGMRCEVDVASITHVLTEGMVLNLGNESCQIIDIPGHSPHGLIYYFPQSRILFSGDVLFYGSVGRSDFGPAMGCDGARLIDGIRQKLLTLPQDVQVYPGHGIPTTIGNEIKFNPYL